MTALITTEQENPFHSTKTENALTKVRLSLTYSGQYFFFFCGTKWTSLT